MTASSLAERSCVLFDLDNTLFDHHYSLLRGIAAERDAYPDTLGTHDLEVLANAHNRALEVAYREKMRDGVPSAAMAESRTRTFLAGLGLDRAVDPRRLAEIYEAGYMADRRATPGSIELLARLRDAGRRVAIVSDGKRTTQLEKAEAIDVWPLADVMITSEDAGVTKPDANLFRLAASSCGAEMEQVVMIGDDFRRDVVGALDAGAAAVHFSPAGAARSTGGEADVPVIGQMLEGLDLLGVAPAKFPWGEDPSGAFGLDMVTTPRHCSGYGQVEVLELWEHLLTASMSLASDDWHPALSGLAAGILVIARGDRVYDAERLEVDIPVPVESLLAVATAAPAWSTIERREFSIRLFHRWDHRPSPAAEAVLVDIRSSLEALGRDHPRAAARALRQAALKVGDRLGVAARLRIEGEGIDAE